jgi:hypothetical protein
LDPTLGVAAGVKGVLLFGSSGGLVVIDKPQTAEIQKIDSMVVLIWSGDLMVKNSLVWIKKIELL